MSVILGLALGAGLVLIASPFLWPGGWMRPRSPQHGLIQDRLVQAGLERLGVSTVIVVSAVLGAAAAFLAFAVTGVVALAAGAGAVGGALPWVMIGWRARVARRAARVVWPDIVDQLVSAARSGLALPDAVAALGVGGPAITRPAFARFAQEYRVTGNFGECLDSLKDRLADPVADRIIETVRMAREVGGGELTTVLRNLSAYLRVEAAVRSEIEARQSWVRNAARLGLVAPWVVLLLLSTRPEAASAYNSGMGAALIMGGLAVSLIAYRLMVRIGRLPEERRWFA